MCLRSPKIPIHMQIYFHFHTVLVNNVVVVCIFILSHLQKCSDIHCGCPLIGAHWFPCGQCHHLRRNFMTIATTNWATLANGSWSIWHKWIRRMQRWPCTITAHYFEEFNICVSSCFSVEEVWLVNISLIYIYISRLVATGIGKHYWAISRLKFRLHEITWWSTPRW